MICSLFLSANVQVLTNINYSFNIVWPPAMRTFTSGPVYPPNRILVFAACTIDTIAHYAVPGRPIAAMST